MKLYFPFSDQTRSLFMYFQKCWMCESNGNGKGGLELHHICGRRKVGKNLDSPLNASVLCKVCHDKVGHTKQEQLKLFLITWKVLQQEKLFFPEEYDIIFLEEQCNQDLGLNMQSLIKLL